MEKTDRYIFTVRYIKEHPGCTSATIKQEYLSRKERELRVKPKILDTLLYWDQINETIKYLKEKNLIVMDGEQIRFHQILDPIQKRHVGFMELAILPTEVTYSLTYKNVDIADVAPRQQGDRGTCGGQMGANIKDTLYIPFDRPDNCDKIRYEKDIHDPDGIIHDDLYFQSASAECAYQISRQLGGMDDGPPGTYSYLVMRALTEKGIAFEDEWPTSTTCYVILREPRDEQKRLAYDSMSIHKIDGFAQLSPLTFESTKAAISKYRCAASSFDVYENYGGMQGGDGTFPEPRGEVVGAHALMLYGYTEDYILCLHTWGDWCGRFGRISKNYFNTCCNDIFLPLDTTEAIRLREEYMKLECISNTPANFYLMPTSNLASKQFIGTYPREKVLLHLMKGKEVTFYVEATEYYNLNLTTTYLPDSDSGIFSVTFPLTGVSFWSRLMKWLKELLGE